VNLSELPYPNEREYWLLDPTDMFTPQIFILPVSNE